MQTVFGFNETRRALSMMANKLQQRTKKAMQDATLIIERAAKENIQHGRADWPALKPSTLAKKKKPTPLYEEATLLRSIHSEADEERGVVGSEEDYAPVHEFGTKIAGRSKNITIPQRAYLEPACREHFKEVQGIFIRRIRGH